MRIRMLSIAAGPGGVHHVGAVRDVPDDDGRALIAGKYAIPAEQPFTQGTVEDAALARNLTAAGVAQPLDSDDQWSVPPA